MTNHLVKSAGEMAQKLREFVLAEDPASVPSTPTAANKHPQFHFQGIHPLLVSTATRHIDDAQTQMQAKHFLHTE